jgi:hypothetical protein
MFDVIQISQAEYQLENARRSNSREVEGTIVQVPNIFDRAVFAVRAVLAGQPVKVKNADQSGTAYHRGAAVAK